MTPEIPTRVKEDILKEIEVNEFLETLNLALLTAFQNGKNNLPDDEGELQIKNYINGLREKLVE